MLIFIINYFYFITSIILFLSLLLVIHLIYRFKIPSLILLDDRIPIHGTTH